MEKIEFLKDCMFSGNVIHKRFQPFENLLSYKMTYFWLDLKEKNTFGLLSWNKKSIFSFFESDFGDKSRNSDQSLFDYYKKEIQKSSDEKIKSIKILCLPRFLNYSFNPISVLVAYNLLDLPTILIFEVSNTFGERHSYLFEIKNKKYETKKNFHVSPFFDVSGKYDINFAINSKSVKLDINYKKNDEIVLVASFKGSFEELNKRNLFKLLYTRIFQNFIVTIGIHYEALKLFVKGAIYNKKPKKPKKFITRN